MNSRAYSELNLRKGATESEIRAAFRKLAKDNHPDTGLNGTGDVDKFRRAYKAYRELLGQATSKPKLAQVAPSSPTPFVFEGQRRHGLDIYVDIALVKPESPGFEIVIPFASHEACPRCLGQGQTLGRLGPDSSLYRTQTCPKCKGQGSIAKDKHLTVTVTSQMAERGKFRLRGAGGYVPSQAIRGDLIVTLRWVDRLPVGN
ncbi:MAG: DnaJ domain-containing protein [Deltaproteobacteria bacterium]|jgi:DnaJ-class molecular chaperone|nr:DnaJ domain-containing protein [Deltaproteobacteria bacterium]